MRTNLRADAEANRTRLVEAARTAIRSHGLDVDVRMITSIADVGLGTFYRNFANKEELLNILIEEIASEFDSLLEDALRINDPAEAFEDFLDAFWAFGNRHGHSHDLRQRIGAESEARNSWVKVEKLIERAKDADLIDRSFATSFVVALLLGVLTANYPGSPLLAAERRSPLSTQFVFRGLLPPNR